MGVTDSKRSAWQPAYHAFLHLLSPYLYVLKRIKAMSCAMVRSLFALKRCLGYGGSGKRFDRILTFWSAAERYGHKMKNNVVFFILILCALFLLPCLGCTAQNKIPSDEPHDQPTVSDNSWTQPDNSSEAVCSQLETIFGTWYGFDDSDYITIYENGEYVSTRFGSGVLLWEEEQLGSNLISNEGSTIPFLMRCFEGQDIFCVNNMYFYCKDKSLGHSLNTECGYPF